MILTTVVLETIVPGTSRYFEKVSGGGPTSYNPILLLYSEIGFICFYDLDLSSL
jgi:hypothetical protein